MKTPLKILRFLFLLIIYPILAIFAPINYLTRKLLNYELMFLFIFTDWIVTKIDYSINKDDMDKFNRLNHLADDWQETINNLKK